MRWISWFASVRTRTLLIASLIVAGNVFTWFVFAGLSHARATAHTHVAAVVTKPSDGIRITSANQINYDWQAKTVELEIIFNQPIDPRQILPRLQLLEEQAHRITVHLSTKPPANSSTIRIVTEAMPRLESATEQTFQLSLLRKPPGDDAISLDTLGDKIDLPIATDQRVTAVQEVDRSSLGLAIRVCFSSPVDLDAVRKAISVEPAVPFAIRTDESSSVLLTGPFTPATRYAVKIADRKPDQDGTVTPRGGLCSVFLPDRRANLWFDHTSGFLGAAGTRRVIVHAMNVSELNVTIHKLYDNNLIVWRNADSSSLEQQGRVVAQRKIVLSGKKNEQIDQELTLDDLLPIEMRGDGVFRIEVTGKSIAALKGNTLHRHEDFEDGSDQSLSASTLLTLTDIALTAKQSADNIIVWATSLHTATPYGSLNVRAFTAENQVAGNCVTDRDGLTRLPATSPDGHPVVLLVAEQSGEKQNGKQGVSWLDLRGESLSFDDPAVHGAAYRTQGYDAFVYGDRDIYRPGETAHLRAVVRDARQQTPAAFPIEFQLMGPDNRSRGTVRAMLDADGSASWSPNLPTESPTGLWTAVIRLPGDSTAPIGSLAFHVEEFIPDRIHVRATFVASGNNARHAADASLAAIIHGDYLFGQPAAKLPATLICRLDPTPFTAEGLTHWTMNDDAEISASEADVHAGAVEARIDDAALDDSGMLSQSFDCNALLSGTKHPTLYHGPWLATLTAEVRETGGRAVTDRTSTAIDRVDRYVAMRSEGVAPAEGGSQQFSVKLLRPDGTMDAEDADLDFVVDRQIWNTSWSVENGRYTCKSTRRLEPISEAHPAVVQVRGGVGTFTIHCREAGEFAIGLTDPKTNRTISSMLQVSGHAWADSVSQEHPESLEVSVLPRQQFSAQEIDALLNPLSLPYTAAWEPMRAALLAPPPAADSPLRSGDAVRVLVRSPFAGTLLLSMESDHVVNTRVIAMEHSSVSIPMLVDHVAGPNVFISATVVRAIDPRAAWRVHRAYGTAPVKLDESDHQIHVAIQAPLQIRPEQSLPIVARLTDRDGNAIANAAVTLAVVDEGICQLTNFITPDPFGYFTRWQQLGIQTRDTYADLMPDTDRNGDVGGDEVTAASLGARHSSPVSARRVCSLAMMSEVLHSDADGIVHSAFPLPSFVGKARVMAASYSGDRFGAAEQSVLVRSDLVVQSSWPRFAAPGDRFRVPLVIFNNTSHDGDAVVHLRASANAPITLPIDQALPPLHIEAGHSATMTFDVSATAACGVADVTTGVTLGGEAFHETVSLPVRPASSMQTIIGNQTLIPGQAMTISLPGKFLDGTGQFRIRITPKPSLNLPEGLDYLDRYPYGCAEQTVSEAFPLVFLPDLGEMIGGDPYPKDQVRDKVNAALDRLVMMQTRSGALPMWAGGADWPWVSIYAAHFCTVAERGGYAVSAEFSDRLMSYVRAQLEIASDEPDDLEREAYACYVLAVAGHPDVSAMSRLSDLLTRPAIRNAPQPTAQTAFHLAAAWKIVNDPAKANALLPQLRFDVASSRELSGNIDSPVRDRAIMLSTLLLIQPDHPRIPALADALAEAGSQGEWRSTQDVAFAVMALGEYARAMKSVQPFNHAELWAGDQKLSIAEGGAALCWTGTPNEPTPARPLTLRIDGTDAARGYAQWTSTGVPLVPSTQRATAGMEIERRYVDESGRPLGTRTVRSGQLLTVELTLKSPQSCAGVVIEDLLPAGLEPENPNLNGSRTDKSEDEAAKTDPQQFVVNRQDFRDDRVVLFGDVAEPGTYHCRYSARAVTSGSFVIPSVSAECMYDLAIHAQSASGGRLDVEPNNTAMITTAARAE